MKRQSFNTSEIQKVILPSLYSYNLHILTPNPKELSIYYDTKSLFPMPNTFPRTINKYLNQQYK